MHRTRSLIHLIATICLVGASFFVVPASEAAVPVVIWVTANTFDMAVNGNCNLMEALAAATNNAAQDACVAGGNAGPDIIAFNIPGGSPATINLTGAVAVDSPVYIDGTTQGTYTGTPLVRLTRDVTPVLRFNEGSAGSDARGLQIDTSGGAGNVVEIYADNVTLKSNHICTNGSSVVGACWTALYLDTSIHSHIGGPLAADRNLFGGERGVTIYGGYNNEITGNYFGVTAAGNALLAGTPASPMHGVNMGHGAETYGNNIRGNVISGDYHAGVYIERYGHDNIVAGNIIGLGADGITPIGNAWGVHIEGAANNTIGGTTAADRNVISYNLYNVLVNNYVGGITVAATGNQIAGNYIGTTADGMSRVTGVDAEDTDEKGVYIQAGTTTTVGGATSAHGNVIAGNDEGIHVLYDATSTQILNNKIGTNATGTAGLRQENGISIQGGGEVMIGDGAIPGRNLISGNYVGIQVGDGAYATIFDNRIGLTATGAGPVPNEYGIFLNGAGAADISRNWIAYSTNTGLLISSTTGTVGSTENCFTGNANYGAYAVVPGTPTLINNWWGSPTGPTHGTNPGGTGDTIFGDVVYSPFLTKPPAACPAAETIGIHSGSTFLLRNSNSAGPADLTFGFGWPGPLPLVGDWNGDGIDTIGIDDGGWFFLRNANSSGDADLIYQYGWAGATPLMGDWNGDGEDTPGLYSAGWFFLRDSNSPGPADYVFSFGWDGPTPLVGDWNGDGWDSIGLYSAGTFFLRNSNTSGPADVTFGFGWMGPTPITGDWDADGDTTVGLDSNGTFFLRNSNTPGPADITFSYGWAGATPLVGTWDLEP